MGLILVSGLPITCATRGWALHGLIGASSGVNLITAMRRGLLLLPLSAAMVQFSPVKVPPRTATVQMMARNEKPGNNNKKLTSRERLLDELAAFETRSTRRSLSLIHI